MFARKSNMNAKRPVRPARRSRSSDTSLSSTATASRRYSSSGRGSKSKSYSRSRSRSKLRNLRRKSPRPRNRSLNRYRRGAETEKVFEIEELKNITVDIRRNIPADPHPIRRDIVNPQNIVLVRRPGEGARPLFDREELKAGPEEHRRVIAKSPIRRDRSREYESRRPRSRTRSRERSRSRSRPRSRSRSRGRSRSRSRARSTSRSRTRHRSRSRGSRGTPSVRILRDTRYLNANRRGRSRSRTRSAERRPAALAPPPSYQMVPVPVRHLRPYAVPVVPYAPFPIRRPFMFAHRMPLRPRFIYYPHRMYPPYRLR